LSRFLSRPLSGTWPLVERLALIAAYGCGFALRAAITRASSSPALLLVSLPLASLVYVAVLYLCGAFNERDRARLGELLAGLRARRTRSRVHARPRPPRTAGARRRRRTGQQRVGRHEQVSGGVRRRGW